MNKKLTGIVAYITWIGWLIAYFTGDKEGAKFHLNQALVLFICGLANSVISMVPVVGAIVSGVISIVLLIFTIMGIISAAKEENKELPIIGSFKILK